jgi:cell division septal protein FtsQ
MHFGSRYKKASTRIGRRRRLKHIFYFSIKIGLPLAFLITLFFFLRADFLQIEKVVVIGNKDVLPEEVIGITESFMSKKKYFFVPNTNYLLLSRSDLEKIILDSLPRIESVDISKKLNNILEIKINERVGDYVWCKEEDECYLMSKNGLIFSKADQIDLLGKIKFIGNVIDDPIMKYYSEEDLMGRLLSIIDTFKDSSIGLLSLEIESPNKLNLTTDVGSIILNPEESLDIQLQNALLLISELSSGENVSFEYVDARFGNKVYYKTLID